MIEINLLPTQDALSQKEKTFRRWLFLAVLSCSAILVLDWGGFFLFQRLLKRQVEQLSSYESSLVSQLEQFSTVALDLRAVEEKVSGIVAVRGQRLDMATRVTGIRGLLTEGITLVSLEVGADKTLSFSAKARDGPSLGKFISQVMQSQNGFRLSKVILSGLRSDVNGGYSFQLSGSYEKS